MKVAVISDIHGNIPAIEAVLEDLSHWMPDRVFVNGDVVNRGPYSQQGLDLLTAELPSAVFLKGNHESFVLHALEHPLKPDELKYELHQLAQWTVSQLSDTSMAFIRDWEDAVDLTDLEGGSSFHVTHGSRLGNRDGISDRTLEEDLPDKLGDPRDLFVVSHTHKTLLRRYQQTLIVNTGSVGQPFDQDPRSSYARIQWQQGGWHAEIARVAYDKQRAEEDYYTSGFMDEAGPLAKLIYLEHQQNTMHVGPMMKRYYSSIIEGELTLSSAVRLYLDSL